MHTRAARPHELVGAEEVLARSHRRAVDRQLLPPEPVQLGGRVRAAGGAADDDAPAGLDRGERRLPGRLADGLDHEVGAPGLLHRRGDVARVVVHHHVGAPPASPLELLVAARRDDRARAERPCDLERRRRDAAADAPDQHRLARLEGSARDEHAVGGLVDERERCGGLEVERIVEREDVRLRHRDQLGVRSVRVLADDGDRGRAVLESRVDHDPLAGVDADARAVGAEDPRLRHRGQPLANPEVEVVQRSGAQGNQNLARPRGRVGHSS